MSDTANNPAWLEWMTTLMGEASHAGLSDAGLSDEDHSQEGASRRTHTATLPPDLFHCLLDELPLHLIPRRAFNSLQLQQKDDEQPLYLNPDCLFCAGGELPEELESKKELFSGFALQGTVAWVRNPATGNLLPFWLGPQLEVAVRSLPRNEAVPNSVPNKARRVLAAANILLPESRISQRQHQREETIAKASTSFREKGYAPLGGLIHPFHIAALRDPAR
jgi:hypothetical protein